VTAVEGDGLRVEAEALVEVLVEVLKGAHPGSGRCAVGGGLAVADLPGLPEPCVLPAAALPEWLAGLVGLGPRPAASAPGALVVRASVLDAVLALDRPDARRVRATAGPAPGPWPGLLAAVSAGLTGRWRMTVAGLTGDVAHLEVLDCGPSGLWAVQPCPPGGLADELPAADGDDAAVLLTPTTPTEVWVWLSRLAGHPE
jgi:hypothetical protein